MMKISSAQAGQMLKMAAANLRALSEENQNLKTNNEELTVKVAHFEKKERAERIASEMENKGIESELSFQEKVAGLMKRDRLDVVEEAVGMSAPQMKLASVHDEGGSTATVTGDDHHGDQAAQAFAANLASLGD